MRRTGFFPLCLGMMLLLPLFGGCQAQSVGEGDAVFPTATSESVVVDEAVEVTVTLEVAEAIEEEAMTVPTPFAGSEQFVTLVKRDLAEKLGISVEEITAVLVEMVVWPDSSMGCPRPGIAYTQVQQDGYRIVLEVEKEQYAYHGGGGRRPFLCDDNDKNAPPAPGLSDE